ncbi:hypothetical protein A3C26_02770 [Candidatus Daviesbacteria bacterium RIFCSPHIGHO2_02_FULL_39_12]|uniref:Uncharacterized protein n=2 Tax=Candidatus Daviesiibacteriota TaxID=1752718 RepID=A0A1F5JCD7_9BACT|nr:MAG: hypothetical protein A3C26_02770 [Candidatus Daviesbacteria bacterium RIFCSPHIGHO2_02_FULL_39_12]OGE72088.1 MAG: hypothetical protein A3H40_03225 [Candidatus Daviesbacteria bacterium RIFCSPLOWO2_02_FULL_38_15]
MNILIQNKFKLLMILLLMAGLISLIYLVQNTQIFKSRANEQLYNAIEVTDGEGNNICQGNKCDLKPVIKFKVNISELERLKNQ